MRRKLRILADLGPLEWLLLLQLIPLSTVLKLGLRLNSLPRLAGRLTRWAEVPWIGRLPLFQRRVGIARLSGLARIATRMAPGRGRCLPRSLLLLWLLRARGEPARLLVGAARQADGLRGHAWVELEGRPVADGPETGVRFSTFVTL